MGYYETEEICSECEGQGMLSAVIDCVKEEVRNFAYLRNNKGERPTFRQCVEYWHMLKKRFYDDGERIPCFFCDGTGTITKRHWKAEVSRSEYR